MTVVGKDFLFIHVPKCAGKSVSRMLGGVTPGVPAHAPRSYFAGGPHDRPFAFGFVRNPWDRMVSTWTFFRTKPPRRSDPADYRQAVLAMSFREWLLADR